MALTITTSKQTHRAGTPWVDGDAALPLVTATAGATGTVNWTDGGKGGTFQPVSATSAIYVPANKSQTVIITGTDTGAGGSGTVTILVTGTFPLQPTRGYDAQLDRDTKMQRARGGTRYYREDYVEEVAVTLSMERRTNVEMLAAWEFWRFHRKVTPFYYLDIESGMLNLVRFESAMTRRFDGAQWWTMSAGVRGDFENNQEVRAAPETVRFGCGQFLYLGDWTPDAYFLNGDSYYMDGQAVNNSALSAPVPPDEVLRHCRYAFNPMVVHYVVTGLRALHGYNCRLVFCIDATRTLSVQAQGVTQGSDLVLSTPMLAAEKTFTVNSDALGQIALDITKVSGANAFVNAIEILEV